MTIIQVVPATVVKEQVWKVRMNIWMMLTPKHRSDQGGSRHRWTIEHVSQRIDMLLENRRY